MNQKQDYTTISEYYKTSKILFGAFILGIVNLGIVIIVFFFLEMLPLGGINPDLTIYAIFGSLFMLVIMSYIGNLVLKNKTENATQNIELIDKLSAYREGKLIQAVTLEASALVALVFVMLLTHIFFVVIAFISLVQMIRSFPSKSEMTEKLDLSYSDQQKLNNADFKLN